MNNSKQSAKVIKSVAELLYESLQGFRITIVIRDPKEEISANSVLIVSNDDPKEVMKAVNSQAIIQPLTAK